MSFRWKLPCILWSCLAHFTALALKNFPRKNFQYFILHCTFSNKDFFSKCDKISNLLWIWSSLLKRSLMENFIFCAVLKSPVWKSFSYFLEKSFSNFQGTELSYIFFKKVFLIFWERNIQNPDIFRTRSIFKTRGIFRTLSSDGMLCKTSYLAHFPHSALKIFLYFGKRNFLIFLEKEVYSLIFLLYFR